MLRSLSVPRSVLGVLLCSLALACAPEQPADSVADVSHAERRAAMSEAPVRLLLVRTEYKLDEDGGYTRVFTQRYKILSQQAIEDWAETGAPWSPWHTERPIVTAKVIDPDGTTHTLDPKTVTEAPVYDDIPEVYSDRRVLRAPLPGVRVGSIVEEKITTKTRRPFFRGGSAIYAPFQGPVPRDAVELIIEYPKRSQLKYEVLDAKVDVKHGEREGMRRITFRGGPYPAIAALDPFAPSELPEWPAVTASIASTWRDIAKAYDDVVDERLQGAGLERITRSALRGGEDNRAKINRLLAELRARVRYAAVHFGDAAIVPTPPKTALERGYGDCKDQAILLVGLLRAAGIDAKVALLRTGPGEDVRRTVPGLNVFNHAIVVVPGDEPIWIDPTASYARAGELPDADQGRWALIVDDSTEALVRTPEPRTAENTYSETREIWLPKRGLGRVSEQSLATGTLEQRMRANFDASNEQVEKWMKDYIGGEYRAEQLVRWTRPEPSDLSRPFRLDIEAAKMTLAETGLMDASVHVNERALFAWLPEVLRSEQPRSSDLVLPSPYKAEIKYRIHGPEGFVVKDLPQATPIEFGPARFARTFTSDDRGVVEAQLTLELPDGRLTPGQVEAIRQGLQAIQNEAPMMVVYEHVGQKHIDAGRTLQGLRTFRNEVQKAPRDALERMRLALTLVDLGFQSAAQAEARKAIELAPSDALARRTLGLVLMRDPLGRVLGKGFDRDGALAALTHAARLDTSDHASLVDAAVVTEHDVAGRRYEQPDELPRAVELYDRVPPDTLRQLENGDYVNNALFALLWARRFDDVQKRLSKLNREATPPAVAIVAVTATRGAMAGLTEADRLGLRGAQRSEQLVAAADVLATMQRYADAAALIAAATSGAADSVSLANRARWLRMMKAVQPEALPTKTPEDVARRLLVLYAAAEQPDRKLVEQLLSARVRQAGAESAVLAELRSFSRPFLGKPQPRHLFADVTATMFKYTVEGNDELGHRVRLESIIPGQQQSRLHVFVVREDKQYRVAAMGDSIGDVGCEALDSATRGKDKRARQWLRWAAELEQKAMSDDPLHVPAWLRIWNQGKGSPKSAAAALCARSTTFADALAALTDASQRTTERDEAAFQLALGRAYLRRGKGEEALAAAGRLLRSHPSSLIARHMQLEALLQLKRHKEREKACLDALRRPGMKPEDRGALLLALALSQVEQGAWPRARATYQMIIELGQNAHVAHGMLAWASLFEGTPRQEHLEHALQSVQMTGFQDRATLHALGVLYVELGKLEDSRQTLLKVLELNPDKQPTADDWFLYGRLAEAYGVTEVAREAYAKVPPTENPASTYLLARKRLAKLGRGEAPVAAAGP